MLLTNCSRHIRKDDTFDNFGRVTRKIKGYLDLVYPQHSILRSIIPRGDHSASNKFCRGAENDPPYMLSLMTAKNSHATPLFRTFYTLERNGVAFP
jgi:hypothetical protein